MGPLISLCGIICMWWLTSCNGYVAYDCGTNPQQVGVFSAVDVDEDCNSPIMKPNISRVNVHLLQLSEYALVHVIQCKIDIDRTISHCGMHSHASAVQNGRMKYVMDLSQEQCARLHETKSVSIGASYITGLKANQSTSQSLTLGGKITMDGQCEGVEYSDPFGS